MHCGWNSPQKLGLFPRGHITRLGLKVLYGGPKGHFWTLTVTFYPQGRFSPREFCPPFSGHGKGFPPFIGVHGSVPTLLHHLGWVAPVPRVGARAIHSERSLGAGRPFFITGVRFPQTGVLRLFSLVGALGSFRGGAFERTSLGLSVGLRYGPPPRGGLLCFGRKICRIGAPLLWFPQAGPLRDRA